MGTPYVSPGSKMSQNDTIMLSKVKRGYEVSHVDIEGVDGIYSTKVVKTLEKAVKLAKKVQDEENPEYGVYLGEGI